MEKLFSGFIHGVYSTRITVWVISEPKVGKKVYEVDAIEIEDLEGGLDWVSQAYENDKKCLLNLDGIGGGHLRSVKRRYRRCV